MYSLGEREAYFRFSETQSEKDLSEVTLPTQTLKTKQI